eukprot:10209155-Prorocentrum_lima.AAC.1
MRLSVLVGLDRVSVLDGWTRGGGLLRRPLAERVAGGQWVLRRYEILGERNGARLRGKTRRVLSKEGDRGGGVQ